MEIADSVISIRNTVHYILLQAKKEPDQFKRDDLAVAVTKLTNITDKLALVTENAPVVLQCISTAKRLAFTAMKYLQVKHSGENFIAQEKEFKSDVSLFKIHYSSLLSYCEKTTGKIPESKTRSDSSPERDTTTEIPTLQKSQSQPARNHRDPDPPRLSSPKEPINKPQHVRSNTLSSPSSVTTVKHTDPLLSHRGTPKTKHLNSNPDDWDTIEQELLGTINEDHSSTQTDKSKSPPISSPIPQLNRLRTSTFGEHSDLLELLLEQGLTPEMIINSTEEELLAVLEQSLLSDSDPGPKTNRNSTQELDARLAASISTK